MHIAEVKVQMYKKMFEDNFDELQNKNANIDNVIFNESLNNKTAEELIFMLSSEQREEIKNIVINKLRRDE
jgi:hypothetical protein